MRSMHKASGWPLLLVLAVFPARSVFAIQENADNLNQWYQWRGPHANGVSDSGTPPAEWSEEKNIEWKTKIPGEGISTPIVWNNRVFLLTAVDTGVAPDKAVVKDERAMTSPPNSVFSFRVICLDLETGETIWEDTCVELAPHEGRHKTSTYAAASPMTDGEKLIVPFGSFGIFCYSLDGKRLWSIDPDDMHTRRGWGEATSPLLVEDLVIMNWDHEDDSSIFALDAATGEVAWKVSRDEPTTWATPLIIERDGRKQVVTNGTNSIVAYDLKSGEPVWSAKGTTLNAIPCPVEYEDNVICMAGYRGNRAVSIRIGSGGEIQQNWELTRGTPYVPSPLLSGNRLYFTQSNKAVLHCVDAATGEYFYPPRRLEPLSNLYGSPVAANGLVYLTDRDGATIVFRDGETFEQVAVNQLDDHFDASPVPVGDRLLLRGKNAIYSIRSQ